MVLSKGIILFTLLFVWSGHSLERGQKYGSEFQNVLDTYDLRKGCIPQNCNLHCQRTYLVSGECVSNRQCKCNVSDPKSFEIVGRFIDTEDPAEALFVSQKSCNVQHCDQNCRRIGFPGGVCVNNHCKCDIAFNDEDEDKEALDANILKKECITQICSLHCQRTGFISGECVSNQCECGISETDVLETGGKILDTKDPDEDLITSQKSCNPELCDQNCRRTGFPGGVCIYNKCKCDIIPTKSEQNEEDSKVAEEETKTTEECQKETCEQQCRDFEDTEGSCINERCQCDVDINDSPIEYTFWKCNPWSCRNMCISMNYTKGRCRRGECRCY